MEIITSQGYQDFRIYTPEQEINYLYRKYWNEPDASLEYMMKYLVKKGVHDPVAMYFRNPCVAVYEECPDGVLDVYHQRNQIAAWNY